MSQGQCTIAMYRPKQGQEVALQKLLKEHVPILRKEGFATKRDVLLLQSAEDGTFLEIFEWNTQRSAEEAHQNPKVQGIWGRLGEVAEFSTLKDLGEANAPFPNFKIVES